MHTNYVHHLGFFFFTTSSQEPHLFVGRWNLRGRIPLSVWRTGTAWELISQQWQLPWPMTHRCRGTNLPAPLAFGSDGPEMCPHCLWIFLAGMSRSPSSWHYARLPGIPSCLNSFSTGPHFPLACQSSWEHIFTNHFNTNPYLRICSWKTHPKRAGTRHEPGDPGEDSGAGWLTG